MIRAGLTAVIALVALAGCSLGSGGETRSTRATAATRQVADAVSALERATAAGDWRRVCDELFTAAARRRAGGGDCARQLRSSAGPVHALRIELVAVKLDRTGADATVRSRARGQPPLTDTLRLTRQDGRMRVDSLR